MVVAISTASSVLSHSGLRVGGYEGKIILFCFVFLALTLAGVFCLSSRLIFFICFELCVVPVFILIIRWGAQGDRIFSRYYFLFYSIVSPAPLLLRILKGASLGHAFSGTFLLISTPTLGIIGVGALTLGFLTKLPLYRLHI